MVLKETFNLHSIPINKGAVHFFSNSKESGGLLSVIIYQSPKLLD